jgi:hypothetical protein
MFRRFTAGCVTALTAVAGMLSPPAAVPESRDAVQACGATEVTRSSAVVHPSVWQAPFLEIPEVTVRCGDGRTYGAVHVEVKHNVPNWADALNCIAKTISRGSAEPIDGKQIYTYTFANKKVTVSIGRNGLITAFPDDNKHESWIQCSQS